MPPRMGGRPGSEEPGQPRKGPKFSIYWIYAIIFAVLIGFSLFSPFSPNMKEINSLQFERMITSGDVKEYDVVTNRDKVKVTLKPESLNEPEYKKLLSSESGIAGKVSEKGPHFVLNITSEEAFQRRMDDFYKEHPELTERVPYFARPESDFFSKVLSFLVPVLLFIALWVLLMRKMGGGAGGGSGPGGIFNIGKSKATLFDKGTRVNITFADVAGLDEAKVEVMEIVDFLKSPKKIHGAGWKDSQRRLIGGPSRYR